MPSCLRFGIRFRGGLFGSPHVHTHASGVTYECLLSLCSLNFTQFQRGQANSFTKDE
uniref:Uncharacterized protein n=1 Tax=Rhizophora mucronata TaxID=61149 RepID=A0A2P2LHJ0_RHIMU